MMHPALAMALGIVIGWQVSLLALEIRKRWRARKRPVVEVRVVGRGGGGICWNELEVVRR